MPACKHKGGRCSCSAPASVGVAGHWRELTGRRKKKRAPVKPKAGTRYWVAESSSGATCGHHHRTASGALRCSKLHERKERAARARLTRKQARASKMRRWTPARVTA